MPVNKSHLAIVVSCLWLPLSQASAQSAADTAGTPATFEAKVNSFATIAQGAMIGAALVGGAVLASDPHDKEKAVKAAGIGAALGGAIGAGVAKVQKSFASKEKRLQQLTAEAEKQNTDLADIVATANAMLADDRAKVTDLQHRIAAATGQAKRDADALKGQEVQQLQQDLMLYDKAIALSTKRLADSRVALADFQEKYQDQDSPGVAAVASNVDAFAEKHEQLKAVREKHVALLETLNVPAG